MWMRGKYRSTPFFALVRRVPGRGESFGIWRRAANDALGMWKHIVANPPPPFPDGTQWRVTLADGRTVEEFERVVRAFEAAWWALCEPKMDLKLARGALELAQREGAALLMAYGHGVRARLGNRGRLVRAIPQLWPKHRAKRKAA